MAYKDSAEYSAALDGTGDLGGGVVVLTTEGIRSGGIAFDNSTGSIATVKILEGDGTTSLATVQVPANSNFTFPPANYERGLSFSGPVGVSVVTTINDEDNPFDPPTPPGPFTNDESMAVNQAGANQNFANGPSDMTLGITAPYPSFSGHLWVKITTAPGAFNGIAGSSSSFAEANGWGINFQTAGSDAVTFYVGIFSSGFTQTLTGIRNGSWHHLAYSFDAANRQYTMWYDGGPALVSAVNAAPASRPIGTDNNYFVNSNGTTSQIRGLIDEPAHWLNVTMTNQEASDLYNGGTPLDPTTVKASPTWWLRCGDDVSDDPTVGSGQVTDVSGNGNNFTPAKFGAGADDFAFLMDVP